MEITNIGVVSRNQLAERYIREGLVVLPQVTLPPSFRPPMSDIVLLKVDGLCEIYIEAATTYIGLSARWREIQSRPESAGGTRLVTTVRGDFFSGLMATLASLKEAGPLGPSVPAETNEDDSQKPRKSCELESRSAFNLTDIAVVHKHIQKLGRPLYLDETELVRRLENRILGQSTAIASLASVIVRHCARRRPGRPAVIFAVGPSGVGKTRTAEVLAGVLREFDDGNNGYQLLRLDMTEYQESHRVSQLIGAPQGYVGHGEGSQLVDALRANPQTIVLFDEIEKAHPAILRVLMNAMDAGRLSTAARSANSREVDCRRAIFLFTSNLDSKEILDELEARGAFGNRSAEDDVCRRRLQAAGIAPEIVGRIGRFLVYRPLDAQTRAEIMALSITEVAEEYGLKVVYVDPSVIVDLMEKVRSESLGVRPERFMIDDALGSAFANAAAAGFEMPLRVCGEAPYRCVPHDESLAISHNHNGNACDV